MSSTLHWRPVYKEYSSASSDIKFALQKGFDLGPDPIKLGRENLSYLKGLVHGGTPDVQLLIDAIEEHDQIELWLAY